MVPEQRPPDPSQRSWTIYLIILGLAVGALVALHIADIRRENTHRTTAGAAPTSSVFTGDMYVKMALTGFTGRTTRLYAGLAIRSYEEALPWPAAYRRIAITKEVLLKESASEEFGKMAAMKPMAGLGKQRVEDLKDEVAMWREIYGPHPLSPERAREFVSRIRKLNLGPLKQAAISDVYARAGLRAEAAAAMRKVRSQARASTAGTMTLGGAMVVAGLLGVVLIVMFIERHAKELSRSGRPRIQPQVLIISFLAYLIGYLVLSVVFGVVAAGLSMGRSRETLTLLLLQMLAMLGAYGLTLATLWSLTAQTGEDPREIGRRAPLGKEILWGVGGYCASLPLVFAASAVSTLLSKTIFKHVPTPEHPLESVAMQGGAAFAVVFVMAVVIAPLVEETAFRGMLYNALRGRMGVWASALLSGAIFAIIHPTLPAGFLPILCLGVVLALLREKTGSLMPGMICHGLNNGVLFLLLWLQG